MNNMNREITILHYKDVPADACMHERANPGWNQSYDRLAETLREKSA